MLLDHVGVAIVVVVTVVVVGIRMCEGWEKRKKNNRLLAVGRVSYGVGMASCGGQEEVL